MKVYIDREAKEHDITFTGKAGALLQKLEVNPETVVITRNGKLITEDETITNDDNIKIISVVSGG